MSQNPKEIEYNKKKKSLLKTIDKIFIQNGVKNITMDDLAKQLHISKRTLYEMYGNKEELLKLCLEMHSEERHQTMKDFSASTNNVIEIMLKSFDLTLQFMKEVHPQYLSDIMHYPLLKKFILEDREKSKDDAVKFFKKGQEQGLLHEKVNFDIVYRMCLAMFDALAEAKNISNISPFQLMLSTITIYIRGAATEKGRVLIDNYLIKRSNDEI